MAKEKGISTREIETVQSIVQAVAGGKVRAQFREARKRKAERRGTEKPS